VKLRIVRHRSFKRDVLQIFVYIGEQNMDAASRFMAAVRDDLDQVSRMPGLGPVRELKSPRYAGVRSLPITGFRNYLLFYRPTPSTIEALRVIHGARDIDQAMGD
jgi:toxin ParE1/3/4